MQQNPTLRPLLDLGDTAQGQVLDGAMWDRESRCRPVRPERLARGSVRVVWPYAPHVVGIVTASGEQLTIRVQR